MSSTSNMSAIRLALLASVSEALGEPSPFASRQQIARGNEMTFNSFCKTTDQELCQYQAARNPTFSSFAKNNNNNNNSTANETAVPNTIRLMQSLGLPQQDGLSVNFNLNSMSLWHAAASVSRERQQYFDAEQRTREFLQLEAARHEMNQKKDDSMVIQSSLQELLKSCPPLSVANAGPAPLAPMISTIPQGLGERGNQAQVEDASTNAATGDQGMDRVHITLQALGSSIRRRTDPYVDCTTLNIPKQYLIKLTAAKATQTRGGVAEPFPEKVFRMLTETELNGLSHIVSFLPHGRSFSIHKPDLFVAEILPRYFQQSKLSSFTRQLNLWGFLRVGTGRDVGSFYHELFLKGYPGLCLHMRRVGSTKNGLDRRKFKCKITDGGDPDFSSMKPTFRLISVTHTKNSTIDIQCV